MKFNFVSTIFGTDFLVKYVTNERAFNALHCQYSQGLKYTLIYLPWNYLAYRREGGLPLGHQHTFLHCFKVKLIQNYSSTHSHICLYACEAFAELVLKNRKMEKYSQNKWMVGSGTPQLLVWRLYWLHSFHRQIVRSMRCFIVV